LRYKWGFRYLFFIIKLNNIFWGANLIAGKIQYWCIDGKYRIYVAWHETDGKTR
jgi:hypothetical protein